MKTNNLYRNIFILPSKIKRAIHRIFIMPIIRRSFGKCGKNVKISTECQFSGIENIIVGNNVVLGNATMIMTTRAKVLLGDGVFLAPKVSIVTGDHRFDIIGKYMIDIRDVDKHPEDDQDVIFEGDNWLGTGVIVLKGVTIGKGAIVAAGSVVTKNIPPYAIAAGIPAKVIKMRFLQEQIRQHEAIINQLKI